MENNFLNTPPYSSYIQFKRDRDERILSDLIYYKYMPLLGDFITSMYKGLNFDILIRRRDMKETRNDWYGVTYMELIIYDVIVSATYSPTTFEPSYRTPHCDEYINGQSFFDTIDSYIPEINKHLLITMVPFNVGHRMYIGPVEFFKPFECWKEHFYRQNTYVNRSNFTW